MRRGAFLRGRGYCIIRKWHKRLPPVAQVPATAELAEADAPLRCLRCCWVLLGLASGGPLAGTQQGSGGDTSADIAGQQWVRTKIQHGSGRDTAGLARDGRGIALLLNAVPDPACALVHKACVAAGVGSDGVPAVCRDTGVAWTTTCACGQ